MIKLYRFEQTKIRKGIDNFYRIIVTKGNSFWDVVDAHIILNKYRLPALVSGKEPIVYNDLGK